MVLLLWVILMQKCFYYISQDSRSTDQAEYFTSRICLPAVWNNAPFNRYIHTQITIFIFHILLPENHIFFFILRALALSLMIFCWAGLFSHLTQFIVTLKQRNWNEYDTLYTRPKISLGHFSVSLDCLKHFEIGTGTFKDSTNAS